MHDSTDADERRKAIVDQIEALKRQHKEEQIARRNILHQQMHEFMQQQKEEDEAHRKAVQEQIEALKRQFIEEQKESKTGFKEKIAGKVQEMQEEHIRKHHRCENRFRPDLGDPEIRKGFLKLHILGVLKAGPSHGYEIMQKMGHHTDHLWTPSPGSMYPALEALESKGFITCQGDGRRKIYSLTSKGSEVTDQIEKKRMEQFMEMKAFVSALLEE